VAVETIPALQKAVARARKARHIAIDTEVVIDATSPTPNDPLRATLVALTIAVDAGEAYYFPIAHRAWVDMQGTLALGNITGELGGEDKPEDRPGEQSGDARPPIRKKKAVKAEPASIAGRAISQRAHDEAQRIRNLPSIMDPAMAPLRELLEDPTVRKTAQNAKFDLLVLRSAGVELKGLEFDTMIASYVLD